MGSGTIYNPATDGKPSAYLARMKKHEEKKREAAERKRLKHEREEINAAMARQALSRDPDHAGVDLDELNRRDKLQEAAGVDSDIIVDFHHGTSKVKRVEREPRHVFYQLGRHREGQEAPTLTQPMIDAGQRLIELYAARHGLAGSPDPDISRKMDRVDGDRPSHDFYTNREQFAGRRWSRIMDGFGTYSKYPRLFELLCQDACETEAQITLTSRTAGKSRWRTIVAQAMGEAEPHAQAGIVRAACDELVKILVAVEGGVGTLEPT